MLWTKGRGGGAGRPLEHLENPQLFGWVALVADLRTTIFSPGGDPVALASRLPVKLVTVLSRALGSSSCLYCLAKGLPPGQGILLCHPPRLLLKALNGFLQEGRQASTCDLEFISYPRTWLRRVQRNPRLTCIVSRVTSLSASVFSKGPWPQQVKSMS